MHPRAPLRPGHFEYRNRQLLAAADYVRAMPASKVFIGDLNMTPWSPYFARVLAASGTVDARRGFGTSPLGPPGIGCRS